MPGVPFLLSIWSGRTRCGPSYLSGAGHVTEVCCCVGVWYISMSSSGGSTSPRSGSSHSRGSRLYSSTRHKTRKNIQWSGASAGEDAVASDRVSKMDAQPPVSQSGEVSNTSLSKILEALAVLQEDVNNMGERGVFNLRPSCPRYAETWDVQPVLQKLRFMGPLPDMSLKSLTLKLVMLMALTQAVRVQTLHLLLYSNAIVDNNSVSLLLGGNIKQCHPKFNVRMLKFHAYLPDSRICVVNTLKEYLNRTENLRKEFGKDNGKLLISLVKPHKSVSKDTVSRWIKTVLADCGINTKKFTAGSVRPASASKAKAMDVPVPIILSKAGWTQETTFAKHYNKITQVSDSFQEAILDSVL
ncbi:uncharacterized protein LOC123516454 [Portunus trituberculatus]|uniref:uncharacterized protein LOC123516454 n=1 Tax=Portunus trituberculatus TaxID=210409 RepID=UPI001E1CDEFC|nr:uncharacterized protein LOC123516454 [Portunus trituberculatus]